ncbi:MAG: hypothetical protein ACR2NF_00300, partial [Pirellulales bacterium]
SEKTATLPTQQQSNISTAQSLIEQARQAAATKKTSPRQGLGELVSRVFWACISLSGLWMYLYLYFC